MGDGSAAEGLMECEDASHVYSGKNVTFLERNLHFGSEKSGLLGISI